MNILVLNCGSSSIKFAIYELPSGSEIMKGQVDRISTPSARMKLSFAQDQQAFDLGPMDQEQALRHLFQEVLLGHEKIPPLDGLGHRVVHGGESFTASTLITSEVLDAIISCNPLAPLHNPANVMGIQLALEAFDGLPQVAVFDTAFHQTLPPKAFRYPVPDAWYKEHSVRRYGFHGSSHRYVSGRAAEQLGRDVKDLQMVILHLGNGSSGSAIRAGESVDTTMGLTPLEGLVMGTRSGDIDPGLFAYMAESKGLSLQEIHSALNKKSGLLGLSGVSSDMQSLQSNSDHPQVELTLDVFYYRTAQKVLSLCAALDRLDALVFTGGIGENSALTRSACVESLKVLGLEVDAKSNDDHGTSRSGQIQKQGTTPILVVQTNEELMIAKDTAALI